MPLAPKSLYTKTILRKASWRERSSIIGHGIISLVSSEHRQKAKLAAMRVMDAEGLLGMNKVVLCWEVEYW